jgi:cobalt/nickel transport system permease protein
VILPADLRLRLAAAFAAVALVSQLAGLGPALCAAALALALFALARQALPWRRLLHLEAFLLLLFLSLPFTIEGRAVLSLGPLSASAEGLARAAVLAGKVTASVLLIALLIGGQEPLHLGRALAGLGLPEPLVRLFIATARYIGVIGAEARRLHDAMRARGFRARSNLHTWRSYGYLIGMLLVRALERADRVEDAMRLRGFSGRYPHAPLPAPALADWAGTALITGTAALILVWDML